MPNFDRILVAVDIDHETLTESSLVAVEHAIKVAKANSGVLTFAHVFELSAEMQERMLGSAEDPAKAYYEKVESLLKGLIVRAQDRGVKAQTRLLFGKAWHRLIQEVLRENHSLLLAGATSRSKFMESLFGSTTTKLLRKCPCPVWVIKQEESSLFRSILVAYDFSEVGRKALEWGSKLAEVNGAVLCILHCLEPAQSFLSTLPPCVMKQEKAAAKERIEKDLRSLGTSVSTEIIIEEGEAAAEISHQLNSRSADLLVMGTIARSGLSGFISGNTAETLLPWIRCSLVALKPPGFVSPVELTW